MPIRRSPNGTGYTRPQPGRDRSEQVVAINRNAWSQSIGISGRNQPVRASSSHVWAVNRTEARPYASEACRASAHHSVAKRRNCHDRSRGIGDAHHVPPICRERCARPNRSGNQSQNKWSTELLAASTTLAIKYRNLARPQESPEAPGRAGAGAATAIHAHCDR
jgi:hypothetical protein